MGVGGTAPDPAVTPLPPPAALIQQPSETEEQFRARSVAFYRDKLEVAPQWIKEEIKRQDADDIATGRNDITRTSDFQKLSSKAIKCALQIVNDVEAGDREPDEAFYKIVAQFVTHESKLEVERQKQQHMELLEAQRQKGELALIEKSHGLLLIAPNLTLDIRNQFAAPPKELDEPVDAVFTVNETPDATS